MSDLSPMPRKRSNRYRHAIRRAWERYGIELDPSTLRLIAERIRTGHGFVTCQYANVIDAEVTIGIGKDAVSARVIVRVPEWEVVTFLPRIVPDYVRGKRRHR